MGYTAVDMIQEFGGQVARFAGQDVRERVMAGSEALTTKTKTEQISLWMNQAIERLDGAVDAETRKRIMEACGTNCSRVNQRVIDRARARRMKYQSEDEFLAAEQRKPQAGTRLEREGNVLYQTYTPQSYSHPMRCFCGLMRALPDAVQASPTYCLCSLAFVRTFWEGVLGRPVGVEVLETALSGSSECRFRISLGAQ